MPTQTFDYRAVKDVKLRKFLQDEVRAIRELVHQGSRSMIQIGLHLIRIRERLGLGMRQFCESELHWAPSTVSNYERCAKAFADLDDEVLARIQPHALIQLCRKNIPDAVVKRAIRQARGGETVTASLARRLIDADGSVQRSAQFGKRKKLPRTQPTAIASAADGASPADTQASLEAILQALTNLTTHLEVIAAGLSPGARDELADELLQCALKLRQFKREPVAAA